MPNDDNLIEFYNLADRDRELARNEDALRVATANPGRAAGVIAELSNRLGEIVELHIPAVIDPDHCAECFAVLPCPTLRIARGDDR